MKNITIIEASAANSQAVCELVKGLLIELDPSASDKFESIELEKLTKTLLDSSKIWAFLAKHNDQNVGVITLHECAAIYAGGVFGEISELYVKPEFRSSNIGELLINAAVAKGNQLGWQRLEVGTPPPSNSPRTIKFYEAKGFKTLGSRLRRLI